MTDIIVSQPKTGKLQLSTIDLNPAYRKEWHADMHDYCHLTRDGEILNNNAIYRKGGLGTSLEADYFMVLKYVEAYYDPKILKMSGTKDPKHLAGHWCIIDKNGVEKQVFDTHANVYLVKDSCLYTLNNHYYNIETGMEYCYSSSRMTSSRFIFLENEFDKDKSKRGVWKIDKSTGTYEIFK